jgi:CelD/BcsL family acetyltransferase involved in cellulose biosynthesis
MSCCAPCTNVRIVDETAIAGLEPEWDSLLLRSFDNRIFLTPLWFRLWTDYFGPGETKILESRSEIGELQAILPLQLIHGDHGTSLTFLGDYNVADYMDGAAEKRCADELLGELWDSAWETLSWDHLELRHVPSTSPTISAIERVAEHHGFHVTIQPDEVCPVALLCSSWDAYLQMLSKKQRHEIRRKLRRAQEEVEWEWRTARSQDDLDRDLEVYFVLHELSVHDKVRFMTSDMRAFFRGLARELLRLGYLRLSIFRRDGVDSAATMSFLHRDRWLLYNSGYDPAQATQSPGIAAVAHAMMDAIEERAVAFDFLSGRELYKYQFGASDTHTRRVSLTR